MDQDETPFSPDMTDEDVQRILSVPPFNALDARRFRGKISLDWILKTHTRIIRCQEGEIIVRRGDWGNSAFFVLAGSCRVEVETKDNPLPTAMLGRSENKRKSIFEVIAQLWRNHRQPEVRDVSKYTLDSRIASSGHGEQTRIFLQDVPAILNEFGIGEIREHEFFGELAALGRMPRTATVFANAGAEMLEIRWQGLRHIMKRDKNLRQAIDTQFRKFGLKEFLFAVPLFGHLDDEQMKELVAATKLVSFGTWDSVGAISARRCSSTNRWTASRWASISASSRKAAAKPFSTSSSRSSSDQPILCSFMYSSTRFAPKNDGSSELRVTGTPASYSSRIGWCARSP